MAPKAKISVTLSSRTVEALDRAVKARRFPSRSEALEQVVSGWVLEEQKRTRDREIDHYYDGLAGGEQNEDREWAALGGQSLVRETTDEDPGAKAKPAVKQPPRQRRRSSRRAGR